MTEQEEFEFRARRDRERASKEPTFGEKAGAALYGLGTGIAGGFGELEKFGAYTVPEFFGAEPQNQEFMGRETIFPTIKEVESGLSKFGIQPPKQTVEEYRTAGEIAPAVAAGGTGLYKLGKYGITKAGDLVNLLRGGKIKEQAAKIGKEAEQVGISGERALTAEQKAAEEAARAEQKTIREKATAAETKAEQAAKAEEKAATKGKTALRELPGVKTLPEAGGFKPIPETITNIGNYIRQQATKFVDAIKSQRSSAADANFTAAKNTAARQESLGKFTNTQPLINKIDSLISKGGTADYLQSLQRLKNDIQATKNFEGLEVIRRKLGDAGFGLPEEGYKAINQKLAKDFYSDLSSTMKEFNKDFSKYLDDYKRLSQNLEAYSTKVGKGLVETTDASGKYFTKTAEQVAKDVFSSPEKFRQFIDAVGGNRQIADAAARRYFAGLAEKATSAKDVENLLRDNRALLNEFPFVRQELTTRYLDPLRQSERRVGAAKEIGKESQQAIKEFNQQITEVDKVLAGRLKNIEQGKTLFSDSINALASAKPGKAIETFDNTVLPKIRDVEAKTGTSLLSQQQIETLRKQAAELEKISDKTQRARVIAGLLGTYLIGQAGTSAVGKLGGQ